jgi:hypothetical protein
MRSAVLRFVVSASQMTFLDKGLVPPVDAVNGENKEFAAGVMIPSMR